MYIRQHAARGIFHIFLSLTLNYGKTVYVMLLPTRFRTRTANMLRYQECVMRLNNQLRKFIKLRCIVLPRQCYREQGFTNDNVHLRSNLYDLIARNVTSYIRQDLHFRLTEPSTILRRLRNWMRRQGQHPH